jgi:hypothetical protein
MLSLSQDPNVAVQAAKDAARSNLVAGREMLLADQDIELGRAASSGTGRWAFRSGAKPPNAVRVLGRRTADSPSGSVPLLFAGVFSRTNFEPAKTSVCVQVDRDIVLVHDRSTSMLWDVDEWTDGRGAPPGWTDGMPVPAGARWNGSVTAVDEFLNTVRATPTTEMVGLVSFATDATKEFDLSTTYSNIEGRLDALTASYPGGSTAIDQGISLGLSTLLDTGLARPLSEKVLVVMTDGNYNSTGSPDDCVAAAAAAHARGVTVYTITFSNDADQDLMTRVAAAGGGRHWHAADEASLADAYRTIADTVTTMLIE